MSQPESHRQRWVDDFNGPVPSGQCVCGATWTADHAAEPGAMQPDVLRARIASEEAAYPPIIVDLEATFGVGDQVDKTGGDYRFPGVVVAAFNKTGGARRYVVEDDRGILHIFSGKNLQRVTR